MPQFVSTYFVFALQATFMLWYIYATETQNYALVSVLLFFVSIIVALLSLWKNRKKAVYVLCLVTCTVICIYNGAVAVSMWTIWLVGGFAP